MSLDGRLPLISVIDQRKELQGIRAHICLALLDTCKQFSKVIVPIFNPTIFFNYKRGTFKSLLHKGQKACSL